MKPEFLIRIEIRTEPENQVDKLNRKHVMKEPENPAHKLKIENIEEER